MSRLFLALSLWFIGSLHAGSFFLRDDLDGFPPVAVDVNVAEEKGQGNNPEKEAGTEPGNQTSTDLSQELEGFHCDPLETLIEEFVNSTALDFYFDMMYDMGVRMMVEDKEELFALLADVTGYDITEHDGRHKLSCALYGVKDVAGLAAFLALPVDMVEMVYEIWQDAFDEAGGMELVNVYSKVAYEFGTWAVETGYPNMPLPSQVSMDDVRDNMREWQTAIFNVDLDKGTHLMDFMSDTILPLRIMPEYTAKILTTAQTTEEMLDKLCIDQRAYLLYSHYSSPAQTQAMLDLMVTVVRILNEFNDMGLFSMA